MTTGCSRIGEGSGTPSALSQHVPGPGLGSGIPAVPENKHIHSPACLGPSELDRGRLGPLRPHRQPRPTAVLQRRTFGKSELLLGTSGRPGDSSCAVSQESEVVSNLQWSGETEDPRNLLPEIFPHIFKTLKPGPTHFLTA